jgi:hypothetical protein
VGPFAGARVHLKLGVTPSNGLVVAPLTPIHLSSALGSCSHGVQWIAGGGDGGKVGPTVWSSPPLALAFLPLTPSRSRVRV